MDGIGSYAQYIFYANMPVRVRVRVRVKVRISLRWEYRVFINAKYCVFYAKN